VSTPDEALAIIVNPATPAEAARLAIVGFEPQPTQRLWLDIASDGRYSSERRAQAVATFFRRQVPAGTTLAELASLLARPDWLRPDDVSVADIVSGKLPVRKAPGETVVVLRPRFGDEQVGGVYLALAGQLERSAVQAVLCQGAGDPDARQAAILQTGFDATLDAL